MRCGTGDSIVIHRNIKVEVPDRKHHFEAGAAGKAFEQQTAVADPDRQAGDPIVMRRAAAHPSIIVPDATEFSDQLCAGCLESSLDMV